VSLRCMHEQMEPILFDRRPNCLWLSRPSLSYLHVMRGQVLAVKCETSLEHLASPAVAVQLLL
jgi:hypothetical protein